MLIRHSLLYIVAKLVPGLLGTLTTAVLTRLLAPSQYGRYGIALVTMTFLSSFAFDWLGLAYLRSAQQDRDNPVVASTFVRLFGAVAGLTALCGLLALGLGAFSPEEAPLAAIGLVMAWAYSWFELTSRLQIAALRPGRYLFMNCGRALFILLGAGGAAWLTRDPAGAAIGTACGTLAGALLGGRPRLRGFDPVLARSALLFGLPLAASLTLASLVNSGTRALLGSMGSLEALGLYTAGFVLMQNTLGVIAAGVSSASYTLAVRAVDSGDAEAARRQLLANGSLLLAVLAPAALGMALTAHGIAVATVGPDYVEAVAALGPWMAVGAFFAGFRAHYLDHAFQLGRRAPLQIVVTGLAAAITLLLSLWLIPTQGAIGAAMAVAVAMAVSCLHAIWAGRRAYPLPLPADAAWRIVLACALMGLCVMLVPGSGIARLLVQVALGAAVYGAACLALDVLGLRSRLLPGSGRQLVAGAL